MCDLPQLLLAHLQREARDARDRAGASREETEKQITATSQQLATHACSAGEVERNVSNLMAHLARAGSH
jgi:hypothetical protein